MYHTNPHTVQELQAEFEVVTEEIIGIMLHDTMVHLQQVHEDVGCHIEHAFI
jgi:hypothetical protein